MKVSVRNLVGSCVMLYILFAGVFMGVARLSYPVPSQPAPHQLVADSTVYCFVRELLAQSSVGYRESATQFYVGRVLLSYASSTSNPHLSLPLPLQQEGWSLHQLCVKDHLLTPEDVVFMEQQMVATDGFVLVSDSLPGYQIISADSLRFAIRQAEVPLQGLQLMQKRYHTRSFFRLSAPVFSRDGRKVIVETSFTCGSACGGGQTWLLQRRQGLWHKVRLLNEWMS